MNPLRNWPQLVSHLFACWPKGSPYTCTWTTRSKPLMSSSTPSKVERNVSYQGKMWSGFSFYSWTWTSNWETALLKFWPKWYFLALLGRKEWKSIRKGKLRIFLQEIWTKDNPNHKIFCFSLEFFLNGLMWGLNDGVVSRGTEWVEANGRSERSPEAHNPIMKTPHHSMKEKFWAET